MSKQVKFNIKLNVDGKDVVIAAKCSVQDLGKALGTIPGKAEVARRSVISMAAVSQTFGNLREGIESLRGTMEAFFEAAKEQELREVQLTTVMKQRMNATDDDVDAIKRLTAAQQEQGVIGDEVQLAGAQQIATFINQRSSLEKLIPAMNNLLAQQKGLNATGQDAVGVGNLIGKVMQGQVSALTRVGVTFTDAQKKVLQYGTESERAAMLAQVITDNVGQMNHQLALTEPGKIKQAANAFGDLQEQVGMVLGPLEPVLAKLGELGYAVSGIVQISTAFGTLAKAMGITTLAQNALTAARSTGNRIMLQASYFTKQLSAEMAFNGKTMVAAALSTDLFKTALRGLMISTVIGAGIVALSYALEALINHFTSTSEAADNTTKSLSRQEIQANAVKDAEQGLTENISSGAIKQKQLIEQLNRTIHDSSKSYDDRKKAIEDMQAIVPDYHASISREGKLFRDNATAITNYVANLDKAAEAEAAYSMMVEVKKKKMQLQMQNQQDQDKITNTHRSFKKVWGYDLDVKDRATLYEQIGGRQNFNGNSLFDMDKAHGWIANWNKNISGRNQQLLGLNAQERYLQKKIDARPAGVTLQQLSNGLSYDIPTTNRTRTPITPKTRTHTGTTTTKTTPTIDVDVEPTGILAKLKKSLQNAEKELDGATTIDAVIQARGKVSDIQKQIDELTNGKSEASQPTIKAEVEPTTFSKGSLTDKRQSYQNATSRAGQIQSDFDAGIIDEASAQAQIAQINQQLQQLGAGIKPIKLHVNSEDLDKAKEKTQGAMEAIEQMGSSISSFGDAIGVPALNIAGTLAQAIATMVMGYAEATTQSAKLGPWAWIAFAATGLAQLTAIIASVKSMTSGSYATGGIVGGNSYSGDRMIAHVNSSEMILNRRQQARLFALANGRAALPNYQPIRMPATMPTSRMQLELTVDGKVAGTATALVLKNLKAKDRKIGKNW